VCPMGTYQPTPGSTSCISCPAGRYQSSPGSLICNLCLEGKYNAQRGRISLDDCVDCGIGSYSNTRGATQCTLCAAGQYSPSAGQTACVVCTPGLYQASPSSGACSPCPIGTFSTGQGMTSALNCVLCAKGTYSNITGATHCASCQPGKFQPYLASVQCYPCQPGSYMNLPGWVVDGCMSCNAGTYSSVVGASSEAVCTLCPDGYFSKQARQTSAVACATCQTGTVSVAQRTGCTACGIGTICPPGYQTPIRCVSGLQCDGTSIQALPGFLPYLIDNCTAAIPCPPGTLCAGLATPPVEKGLLLSAENRTHFVVYENGPLSTPLSCPGLTLSYGYQRINPSSGNQNGAAPQGHSILFRLLPLLCPAGQFLSDSACIPCDPGTYSTAMGALFDTTCSRCSPGTYSALTGATSCTPARPGEFVSTYGAPFPDACAKGTYQPDLNSTGCLACQLGTVATTTGMSACAPCAGGTVQPSTGGAECIPCDNAHFSSPGDAVCSACGATPTVLDPAHECPPLRLPASNLSALWLTVEGETQDDCISMGPSSVSQSSGTGTFITPVQTLSRETACVHTLRVMGRPELLKTWTIQQPLDPRRPTRLRVYPYNETFYPALCAKQGFGVLFTVEDDTGEMRTTLTGARAVISIFDPSGQNLLFWMPCSRLPNDLNANIPLGACHIANFCPTMQVLVTVSVEWTGGGKVQGSTVLTPGPVSPCPPTSSWLAVAELVTPGIPYFPGDSVQVQIRSINSPGPLAVFKFALRILAGVTFVSFTSDYATVSMVDRGILSVMGDSSASGTTAIVSTDVLGVLTLRLDAAFSGVALIVQIMANTFQITLANAMPYAMSTRTSGFTCRYDGYVDMLADVQRFTTLIAIPRRKLLINWRTLQDSARSYPTSIDVVGVGNVMKSYSLLPSAQCTSLSPGQLLVQSCASIQPTGTLGSSQATVRVSYQESAVALVNLTVAVARIRSVQTIPALSGLAGRFKVFARLWDGRNDIFPVDVDATPYMGALTAQGARVASE
jgi:hypothetical protein